MERIRGDRTTGDLAVAVAGRRFDAAVDFAAYTAEDGRGVIAAFGDRGAHYVLVSTGQVYLVREGCPRPSRESDYAGKVMSRPADPGDVDGWQYGSTSAPWRTSSRARVFRRRGSASPS